MYKFVSLSAAIASTASAAFHWGGCPADYKPQATFDVERYSGVWYEILVDKYIPFELFSSCVQAEYTLQEDNSVIVNNRNYGWNGWTDMFGTAVQTEKGDASLSVKFFDE